MREIKFRAWHREKKCWLDSVRIYGDGSWSGSIVEERGEVDGYDERECELVQYTGLKDKNGKEIYEGDILEHRWLLGTKDIISRGVIVNRSDSMGFTASGFSCQLPNTVGFITYETWDSKCEVIGNIYENPEIPHSP